MEDLSALLAEVDPHRRGVPVLLRQYLKLGGKILGFNRDPNFSQALDGLILVDLRQTPAPVLQRYMGKEGWVRFAACHGQDPRKAIPVELGGGLEWGERPC